MTIEFKLSRDPLLLEQYYKLRERCFREELGITDFDGSEDEMDRQGQIFLAIENGRCIGGARISSQLSAQEHLGELSLPAKTCCMWERLFLDPTARSLQFARDFCMNLVQASCVLGYHHALVLSSLRNARFYRQCHSAMEVGFKIHKRLPEEAKGPFAGLEHYLSVSQLHEHGTQVKMAQPLRLVA